MQLKSVSCFYFFKYLSNFVVNYQIKSKIIYYNNCFYVLNWIKLFARLLIVLIFDNQFFVFLKLMKFNLSVLKNIQIYIIKNNYEYFVILCVLTDSFKSSVSLLNYIFKSDLVIFLCISFFFLWKSSRELIVLSFY